LTHFDVVCNESSVRPTAKSLILDLLSTARGGAMPVRALVAAAALFEIGENGVRVELARLTARGLVQRNERGQYVLARAAAPVHERVSAWKDVEDAHVAWTGGWIAVHTAGLPRRDRVALRRRERALRFLGLRELHAGLWIRPDNLRGGVAKVTQVLRALGLEASAPTFVMTELAPELEANARGLWDTDALRADYRELTAALDASERRLEAIERRLEAGERGCEASARGLAAMPPRHALVESFLLGGRAIRTLALDPLLPEALVPSAERSALVEAMQRYDRVGRRLWADLMPAAPPARLRNSA
jgi:phenylacetic acid degradation operon negative regulatory protein